MKNPANCPDLTRLSQFFDHELEAEEYENIAQHLKDCAECRAQAADLRKAEEGARITFSQSPAWPSLPILSRDCLSPELVSAYVQRVLPAVEGARTEKHLQHCDRCLSEVMEAFRITSSLLSAKPEPVPIALKTQITSLWASPSGQEQTAALSRIVIQIAPQGLRLLEQHLVAPFLDAQELLISLPAYRSEEDSSTLHLMLQTSQMQVRTTAVQAGGRVALKMTFREAGHEVITGQRGVLRQDKRTVFSARTDSTGTLQVPRLDPGTYEVTCPGMNIAFQLELRSEH